MTPKIQTSPETLRCDGCGQDIAPGAMFLSGIESCCGGGCTRLLCANCIRGAWMQLARGRPGAIEPESITG